MCLHGIYNTYTNICTHTHTYTCTHTLNVNALDPNLGFYPYVTVSKASIYTSTAVDVGVISKLLRTTHHGEWWHVLWTSVACH